MHSLLTRIGMGIVLVAIGLLVAEMFLDTRKPFEGTVALATGERFDGWPGGYLYMSVEDGEEFDFPHIDFEAVDIRPTFDADQFPTGSFVQVRAAGDAPGEPFEITEGHPFVQNGTEIEVIGIELAPVFQLRVPDQGSPVKVCVKLEIWGEGSPEDHFDLPHPAARVYTRFFPDLDITDEGPMSRTEAFKDPALAVQVLRGTRTDDGSFAESAEAEDRFMQILRPGDEMDLESIFLGLDEIRYWALFRVTRTPMFHLLNIGGALAVLGALLAVLGLARAEQAPQAPQ